MEEEIYELIYRYEKEIKQSKRLEKEAAENGNYIEAIQMNFAVSMNRLFLKDLESLLKH